MAFASIEYGHWGITVSQRRLKADYAPFTTEFFPYPVGTRGPVNSASVEADAIRRLVALGGSPKGPFFRAGN